jgi:hypothetical protein
LTLPIILDDTNAPTAYLSLTLTFEPQTSLKKLESSQVRDFEQKQSQLKWDLESKIKRKERELQA